MESYGRVWRAFSDNEVSHSAAHYLLAIAALEDAGQRPRAADIARRLEVSRAAVSLQLRTLRAHGLIDVDSGRRIRLSPRATELVSRIAGKREIVRTFLAEVLGVDPETAENDACKIEHLLSEETAAALLKLLRYLDRDEAGRRVSRLFREVVADCAPHARCEFCTRTCLLRSMDAAAAD